MLDLFEKHEEQVSQAYISDAVTHIHWLDHPLSSQNMAMLLFQKQVTPKAFVYLDSKAYLEHVQPEEVVQVKYQNLWNAMGQDEMIPMENVEGEREGNVSKVPVTESMAVLPSNEVD